MSILRCRLKALSHGTAAGRSGLHGLAEGTNPRSEKMRKAWLSVHHAVPLITIQARKADTALERERTPHEGFKSVSCCIYLWQGLSAGV